MRWEELAFLPSVRAAIVRRGVTFTNAFVVNPTCCPSRASILTGRYSHSTRVYTNDRSRFGGWPAFRPQEEDTIATRITDRYETGLVGKYLNAYRGEEADDVPPGWDDWIAFSDARGSGGAYQRYSLIATQPNGRVRVDRYGAGTGRQTYSTDVLADAAVSIIRSNLEDPEPLFLIFAPFAPHGPATPARRHASTPVELKRGGDGFVGPSLNERDVSDKPRYIRGLTLFTDAQVESILESERRRIRTLLAVDDAVARLVQALRPEIRDTVFIFTSDNGIEHGEHRWRSKDVPYDGSAHVPFVVRYDRLGSHGRVVDNVVANIDIAPTLMQLTRSSRAGMEGLSLVRLLEGGSGSRRAILVEHLRTHPAHQPPVPSFCALRTRNLLYVRYATGEEELYDDARDPHQLRNLLAETGRADGTAARLRRLARRLCDPLPPGMRPF
jgi:arylsulfatase A-like enzyme